MAFCTWHSNRQTNLACSSCDRPICTECVVHSPVGMRCPECWYMRRGGIRRRTYGGRTVLKGCIVLLLVGLVPFALLIYASIVGGFRYDIRSFLASSEPTITPPPIASVVDDTPTPRPMVTPVPQDVYWHISEKRYMLDLINQARESAGVPPVELGNNVAAQRHAESALANCFSSHWGIDGLKPYMRYTLAGGYQSNAENGSGSDYCIRMGEGYAQNDSAQEEIHQVMEGLMDSPGHRRNILNKWHTKVNIGLAWDRYNFAAYQHFEGDYVEYDRLPSIKDGSLSFSGRAKNEASLTNNEDALGVHIYYDHPTHALTRGQVSRTYCYDNGRHVAAIRYPLTGRRYWSEDEFTKSYKPCPNPYEVPASASAPSSHFEAHAFWQGAYIASRNQTEQTITVPWITASKWEVRNGSFAVEVDIREVLEEHGNGVYTIVVFGDIISGEDVVISQYSIFHGVTPPDTYVPSNVPTPPTPTPNSASTITPTTVPEPTIATTYTVTLFPVSTNTPIPTATVRSAFTPTPTSTHAPTATPTPPSAPTPIPVGTSRDNPIPLRQSGTTHDGFEVQVIDVRKDAHEIVVQANESKNYYEGPPDGHVYILVRIRVRSLAVDPQELSNDRWSVVGPSQLEFGDCRTDTGRNAYYPHEVPDEYDDDRLMFQGAELEGNLCFTVKSSDVESLVMFDNRRNNWLFFALQ